jgi:uncharacterized protein YjbI with pentapeptide repeats
VLFLVDENHLAILKKGVEAWNEWRQENPSIKPNLCFADLIRTNLIGANLGGANLSGTKLNEAKLKKANLFFAYLAHANLSGADLSEANLTNANLDEANLTNANLSEADLFGAFLFNANLEGADLRSADLFSANLANANLSKANLEGADLFCANISGANLSGADLSITNMINVDLRYANLSGCRVYGVSAWNARVEEANQSNLVITPYGEPVITVDNLEVAQFIYILLHSEKIRNVIDTITSKVVLILGRFSKDRKLVLDAIREELRERDYLPILFDFEKPKSRNITETIKILAGMARFVIADITDAKSIPQELQAIVPDFPSVPVQPIILSSDFEYGMFDDFRRYPWVLEIHQYNDIDDLLKELGEKVVVPAENRAKELQTK